MTKEVHPHPTTHKKEGIDRTIADSADDYVILLSDSEENFHDLTESASHPTDNKGKRKRPMTTTSYDSTSNMDSEALAFFTEAGMSEELMKSLGIDVNEIHAQRELVRQIERESKESRELALRLQNELNREEDPMRYRLNASVKDFSTLDSYLGLRPPMSSSRGKRKRTDSNTDTDSNILPEGSLPKDSDRQKTAPPLIEINDEEDNEEETGHYQHPKVIDLTTSEDPVVGSSNHPIPIYTHCDLDTYPLSNFYPSRSFGAYDYLPPPPMRYDHSEDDGDSMEGYYIAPLYGHPQGSMRHSVSTYDGQQFPERHLNSAETEQQLRDLLENLWSEEEEQEAMPALEDRTGTPDGLVVTLMEHQKVGLRWLKKMEASKNKGGILSDDMGLGKTIQAIALILDNQCQDATPFDEIESSFKGKQKQKGDPLKVKGTLVVCPVSLIAQWEKEINQKTSPPLSVLVYHGAGRKSSPAILAKYDVIITSYNVLSGDVGRDTDKLGTHHRDIDKGGPLSNFIFHRIILDEAHTIKNRRTRMAEGCCLMKAEFRWCMTATPIQNNIGDLYSLIKFLQIRPYCEWDQFRDCISRPLKMGRHKQALKVIQILLKAISLRRSKKSTIDGKPILNLPERNVHFTHISFTQQEREFYDYVDAKAQACFEKLVNAGTVMKNYSSVLVLLLRLRQACLHPRLTNEEGFDRKAAMEEMAAIVQSMPEVVVNRLLDTNTSFTEIECPICMDMADQPQIISDCGHMLCRECLYNFLNVQDGVNGNKKCPQCRGILTRDKVVTVDQFLKVHAPERHQTTEVDFMDSENTIKIQELTTSSKINKMIEILNDTRKTTQGKDKTIVFSQFTSMLDVLGAPLLENNYNFVRYDGAMTVRKRADVLEKFSTDPSITVLLVSTKCGSLGLNLTTANRVILLDIWWNPALENQAIDRVHRIGQTKPVEVHRIFIKDTVEDRILELQKSKQALCDGALGEGSGEKLGRLGLQEMLYLFSRNASSDT